MKLATVFAVPVALLATCLAVGAPSSRPAIEIPKDETPLQALKRQCHVFDTLDYDAVLKLFSYSGAKEEKFTRLYCRFAIALTKVELSVVKKFDRKTADDLMHACDVQTESDVDGSEVELDGDKATVKLKGAQNPTILRRVDGVWKIAVAEMLKDMSDDDIKSAVESYEDAAKALPPIAADIAAGKYATAQQAIRAVKRIMNPSPASPKQGL